MGQYYNIDDILAEDCTIPCTTLFPFATLGHLDEHCTQTNVRKKRKQLSRALLEEGTSLQLPLWCIRRWGELNFVRLHMPRQYARRTRERLMADPANADLRRMNSYYTSGLLVCEFMERCVAIAGKSSSANLSREMRLSFAELQREVLDLRSTLLKLYTGQRLRRSLDWSLSSVGQDVSHYTRMLTDCEMSLFKAGLQATQARLDWKAHGSSKIPVSKIMTRWNFSYHQNINSNTNFNNSSTNRTVTPEHV